MRSIGASRRAARVLVVAAGVVLVAAASLSSRESDAQCNRSCAADKRDEHGCCPSGVAAQGTSTVVSQPAPKCQDGQEVSADTANHCCWAGQVWSNNKCVGVPTRCPDGRDVDAAGQQCKLRACVSGMSRAPNDKDHCCWNGQVWSKTRSACVGVPKKCPAAMEVEGEACVSVDKDGDGIPNATDKCPNDPEDKDGFQDSDGCPDPDNDKDGILDVTDKCPNEPEDKNGFQDADGCPDEPARLVAEKAAAEEHAKQEAANREAERQQQELAQRQKETDERFQREMAHDGRVEEAKTKAADNWDTGLKVTIVGGAIGFGWMAAWMAIGASQTSRIKDGGFDTAQNIQSTVSFGKLCNTMALVGGIVGGVSVVIGGTVMITNREPKPSDVAVSAGPNGLTVRGSF